MAEPRALILGISGQDGSYLARFLLEKGYQVHGTTRRPDGEPIANAHRLGIATRIARHRLDPIDRSALRRLIQEVRPQEIYHLAGASSVARSFQAPREAFESNCLSTLHLLEAVRDVLPDSRLYHAGSGEAFGETARRPANEETPLRPLSPYGLAKATAHTLVKGRRKAHGLFAVSGILFNHESVLRPETFVTRKIVRGALSIASGEAKSLSLGRLDVVRDWGYAPEYVDPMWRMLRQETPEDLVIATGVSVSLREFAAEVFRRLDLVLERHLVVDPALTRPAEITVSRADPSRAQEVLGWSATTRFPDLVGQLLEDENRRGSGS